jgi:hypothetical protein
MSVYGGWTGSRRHTVKPTLLTQNGSRLIRRYQTRLDRMGSNNKLRLTVRARAGLLSVA